MVGSWNDLSTFIAKLKKGDSADYILSKGFSTPQATFKAIEIANGTVTIDGGGHAILDGCGTSQLFQIEGGSLFAAGATLIVKGVTPQNGYVKSDGGAVAVGLGGLANFSSCSFVKNTAGAAGAVYFNIGSARIVNCSFEADGHGTNSKNNGILLDGGGVMFGCPTGTTGADLPMPGDDLGTSYLAIEQQTPLPTPPPFSLSPPLPLVV
jgi:hypothetical protein